MEDAVNLLDGLDIDLPTGLLAEGSSAQQGPSAASFFGPYQLIQEVGIGGVARVMRARHIHPQYADHTFALKILHEELSHDPQVVGLFRGEAYVLAMLNHPNIIKTFEAGAQDDRLFIAMEYIDGRDLDGLVERSKRGRVKIPIPVALHIIGEVLRGLAYAHDLTDADGHRLNLVHRDVNPANVFLSYDGKVKLGDFGVAAIAAGRVEKSRELAGKLGYFAPEQLAGDAVDQRADLFATGVMLYEVLCGVRLFEGDDTDKVMRLNKRAKIPKPTKANPNIPPPLEEILLKALEREPQNRFVDARQFLAALKPFLPDAKGMTLAAAALMRKVFLREHVAELQLREGLAGSGSERGSGQLVALFTRDERAQAAFNELLLSRGYRVETHVGFDTLAQSAKSGNPPNLALLDVCSDGFTTYGALAALGECRRPIPVVAISEGLDPDWIKAASSVGAVDLLFKPFNVERVLSAVRATVMGAARQTTPVLVERAAGAEIRPRLLVVSSDPKQTARLSKELTDRGFWVDVSPNAAEAVERAWHESYQIVVYDAFPASPADRNFAGQFRNQPGMGLVPIVYLAEPSAAALFAGVDADRCALRPRTDTAAALTEVLNRLRADVRLGRTFVRYTVNFPAELRYGGRVFTGHAIDLSRGGVMLRCEQMPPVGTAVSVGLRPPTATGLIEANGKVVRVDLPKEGEHLLPGVGVEFERFARKGEAELIEYLGTLDQTNRRRQTIILGNTPPSKPTEK
jgi:serine/threonine-protein kinase